MRGYEKQTAGWSEILFCACAEQNFTPAPGDRDHLGSNYFDSNIFFFVFGTQLIPNDNFGAQLASSYIGEIKYTTLYTLQ